MDKDTFISGGGTLEYRLDQLLLPDAGMPADWRADLAKLRKRKSWAGRARGYADLLLRRDSAGAYSTYGTVQELALLVHGYGCFIRVYKKLSGVGLVQLYEEGDPASPVTASFVFSGTNGNSDHFNLLVPQEAQ